MIFELAPSTVSASIDAWPLAAVFAASLAGSVHCVAMCGGFALLAGAGARSTDGPSPDRKRGHRWLSVLPYHGARVFAYASLGALAGGLGSGLDLFGHMVGLQRAAGLAMGVVLLVTALATLRRSPRLDPSLHRIRNPKGLRGRVQSQWWAAQARLANWSRHAGWRGAAAAGLLSAALPCLWLWSFVALSASTGDAVSGALVMASFGMGTVPALLFMSSLMHWLRRRWAHRAPSITASILVVLAFGSMLGWLGGPVLPPGDHRSGDIPSEAACHGKAAWPAASGAP